MHSKCSINNYDWIKKQNLNVYIEYKICIYKAYVILTQALLGYKMCKYNRMDDF